MKPRLIPLAERVGRFALNRRGVSSRWVATDIAPVHFYDAPGGGSLPTTLLLHGIGSAATPFAPLLAGIRPHVRRVVAPDYPGHGFSGPPNSHLTPEALFDAVEGALDTLDLEPSIVVGNSLGGALALQYAIERPERVRALVLVSPAGARMTDDEWRALKRTFDVHSREDALAFVGRLYHRPSWLASAIMSRELPALMKRPAIRQLLESATPDHARNPDEIRALRMPILLLWGQSERLLPASSLAYFREHLPPHAVIEEPHGFGHCPHFDDPRELARRITTFARSLPTQAA